MNQENGLDKSSNQRIIQDSYIYGDEGDIYIDSRDVDEKDDFFDNGSHLNNEKKINSASNSHYGIVDTGLRKFWFFRFLLSSYRLLLGLLGLCGDYCLGFFLRNFPNGIIWIGQFKSGVFLLKVLYGNWSDWDKNGLMHYGASEHNLDLVKLGVKLGCKCGVLNADGKNELHLFFENLIYEKQTKRGLGDWCIFMGASILREIFDFLYGADFTYRNKKILNAYRQKRGIGGSSINVGEGYVENSGMNLSGRLGVDRLLRWKIYDLLVDLTYVEKSYGFSCNEELMVYLVDELGFDISVEYGQVQGVGREYRKWKKWNLLSLMKLIDGQEFDGSGVVSGWKNIDLVGNSVRNILGTSIEIVMLNYWLFLREVGVNIDIEDDLKYRKVIQYLISRGAKINEINRSDGYDDNVKDAMQESVIRVLCSYFVRFLGDPQYILVFRDILSQKGFDPTRPVLDGNTFLHFLLFKFTNEQDDLMKMGFQCKNGRNNQGDELNKTKAEKTLNDLFFDCGVLGDDLELGRLKSIASGALNKVTSDFYSQVDDKRVISVGNYNNSVLELVSDAIARLEGLETGMNLSDRDVDNNIGEIDEIFNKEDKNTDTWSSEFRKIWNLHKKLCIDELLNYRAMYGGVKSVGGLGLGGMSRYDETARRRMENGFWFDDDIVEFKSDLQSRISDFLKKQDILLNKDVLLNRNILWSDDKNDKIDELFDKNDKKSTCADKNMDESIKATEIIEGVESNELNQVNFQYNSLGLEVLGLSHIVMDLYSGIGDLRILVGEELKSGQGYIETALKVHMEVFDQTDMRVLEAMLMWMARGGNLELEHFFIENRNGDKPIDYLAKNSFLTQKVLLNWLKMVILEGKMGKLKSDESKGDLSNIDSGNNVGVLNNGKNPHVEGYGFNIKKNRKI